MKGPMEVSKVTSGGPPSALPHIVSVAASEAAEISLEKKKAEAFGSRLESSIKIFKNLVGYGCQN